MTFDTVKERDTHGAAPAPRRIRASAGKVPKATGPRPGCRWLLVTGAPRSGTTFLNQLLNSHPQIGVATENGLDAIVEGLLSVLTLRWIGADGRDSATDADDPKPERLRDLAQEAFRLMFGKSGLTIVGDKMPSCDAARLRHRALLGNLAQMHIVRRPSDVVASSMQRRHNTVLGFDNWHVKAVEGAIIEWVDAWERLARIASDPDVLVLSYDRFRIDAAGQIAKIEAFLGVKAGFFNHAFAPPPPAVAMTQAEDAIVTRILGELDRLVAQDVHLALRTHPRVLVVLSVGKTVYFDTDHPLSGLFLKAGFGEAEASGTWTVEERAHLAFRLPPGRSGVYAVLTFSAYGGERNVVELLIGDDGGQTQTHVCENADRCVVAIPCRADGEGVVSLRLGMPMRKGAGEEPIADTRELGVFVRSLTLFAL